MRNRGLPPPSVPLTPSTTQVTPHAQQACDQDAETQLVSNQLPDSSLCQTHPIHLITGSSKSMPDIYSNARFEQIACAGLSMKFDGSAETLIPTLDLIHIRRINEVWNSATYITDEQGKLLDLIHHFSKVPLELIKQQAKILWDSTESEVQRHTRCTATYHARLFGVFLLNSLTPDFAALLFSRIDQAYHMDGPLLFITMCTHIHRNHVAFVESVKNKI